MREHRQRVNLNLNLNLNQIEWGTVQAKAASALSPTAYPLTERSRVANRGGLCQNSPHLN